MKNFLFFLRSTFIDDEINEINWRYIFQETLNNIRENKLDDGAKPLPFENQCKIRIKKLGDIPYIFPLSNALCSRIICEHGLPLSLSNKYDFCGTKVRETMTISFHSLLFGRSSIPPGKSIVILLIFHCLFQLLFEQVHSNNFI